MLTDRQTDVRYTPTVAQHFSTWMIEVELSFDSLGFLFRSEHFVKTVLAQGGDLPLPMIDLILPQHLHDLGTY